MAYRIFRKRISSDISLVYDGHHPVIEITQRKSNCVVTAETKITEEEWTNIKEYMEQVYP